MRESDILHETKNHWVMKVKTGKRAGTYEVYKNGITHSTRCSQIGYKGTEGLERAIKECERRENNS